MNIRHITKSLYLKVKHFALTHKILASLILIVLVWAGYGVYSAVTSTAGQTIYALAPVERRTLSAEISGSGQVSAANQVELKAKAAGDVVYLNAAIGQEVAAGTLLVQVEASDAQFEYENAKISYDDLIAVDPDDLRRAQDDLAEAEDDLEAGYTSGRAVLTTASTDMADVLSGLEDLFSDYLSIINNPNANDQGEQYIERAETAFYAAKNQHKDFVKNYRTVSAETTDAEIEIIANTSYEVALDISQAAKYAQDAVIYLRDREDGDTSDGDDAYDSVTALVDTAHAVVTSLATTKTTITTARRALKDAQETVRDLTDGPDTIDLRAQELELRKKQDALSDHYVRAPFDGVVAKVDVKKGDSLSVGDVTVTLITKAQVAELSLNEVDAASVQAGQQATLTFDAVSGLVATGTVLSVDGVGVVEQGVVNYGVEIAFAGGDSRVKSGMTVNALIVTETRDNVLAVPASAVKSRGDEYYVEVLDQSTPVTENGRMVTSVVAPRRVPVVIGLTNDTSTEIISGVAEGELVISRTTVSTGAPLQTAPSATSILRGNSNSGSSGTRLPR